MKEIAGTLKLELAQYREVESFSSFASELDEATQHTLFRGVRLIELLKQPQYLPLIANMQIIMIYSGMKGFLDRFQLSEIDDFLWFLYGYIYSTNILVGFDSLKKINHKVFNSFLNSAIDQYLTIMK
jgi:F-type H+-transporting ATPase subunit alpha